MEYENPSVYDDATINKLVEVISQANDQSYAPVRIYGCGRVYVRIGYKAIRSNSKLAKKLTAAGLKMFKSPGTTGVGIYVGYDNAHGAVAAKAEAILKSIKEAFPTMPAYTDYQGD